MGCDIHIYPEYERYPKQERRSWDAFGGRINPGRDYTLFGYLAGVRGDGPPVAELRGVPDDASLTTKWDNWLFISDDPNAPDDSEGVVNRATAERYAKHGATLSDPDAIGKPQKVSHPDWHSHSWLTLDEFADALAKTEAKRGVDAEYKALVAALRELERLGHTTRVVFWFDN